MQRTRKLVVSLTIAAAFGLSFATYSLAQGGPGPGRKHGMMADGGAGHPHACRHECEKCPVQQLSSLADLKVEKTKSGATVQFSAKDPTKVGEVQSLAEELVALLKAGSCPMMEKGGQLYGKPPGR